MVEKVTELLTRHIQLRRSQRGPFSHAIHYPRQIGHMFENIIDVALSTRGSRMFCVKVELSGPCAPPQLIVYEAVGET